jgi:hypothetical protein
MLELELVKAGLIADRGDYDCCSSFREFGKIRPSRHSRIDAPFYEFT